MHIGSNPVVHTYGGKTLLNRAALEEPWRKDFRLSMDVFYNLLDKLGPYISPNPLSPNTRALNADKKLAVTLYYSRDTGSLNMTANTFGLAICTVLRRRSDISFILI